MNSTVSQVDGHRFISNYELFFCFWHLIFHARKAMHISLHIRFHVRLNFEQISRQTIKKFHKVLRANSWINRQRYNAAISASNRCEHYPASKGVSSEWTGNTRSFRLFEAIRNPPDVFLLYPPPRFSGDSQYCWKSEKMLRDAVIESSWVLLPNRAERKAIAGRNAHDIFDRVVHFVSVDIIHCDQKMFTMLYGF